MFETLPQCATQRKKKYPDLRLVTFLTILLTLWTLTVFGQLQPAIVDINIIIQIESNGRPDAYNSKSGCIGLMQINPDGALADWNERNKRDAFNIGDMYDPAKNVLVGTSYLNFQIPLYIISAEIEDTIDNRLIAYNWGIGNLIKYKQGKKKLPNETVNYIKKYHKLEKARVK